MNNTYQIYLISDSTGETLDRIFLALKAQFLNTEYKVHSYSFTRTENQILKILEDAETGDISYYFLGELDLNKGFRLSGTTKYNLFQEVNAGSFENSSLVCAAGDIKYATGTNDTITSVSELDFSKFFKVVDRIKIVINNIFFIVLFFIRFW